MKNIFIINKFFQNICTRGKVKYIYIFFIHQVLKLKNNKKIKKKTQNESKFDLSITKITIDFFSGQHKSTNTPFYLFIQLSTCFGFLLREGKSKRGKHVLGINSLAVNCQPQNYWQLSLSGSLFIPHASLSHKFYFNWTCVGPNFINKSLQIFELHNLIIANFGSRKCFLMDFFISEF
ncbi:unnamed protein product [Citrullus colocynthis]|uniref:Ribosomal protein L5 n=1 Tax=Citrullus colocynthis TaxID=252529 RepID=A0ABP0XY79_9ROSI